MTHAHYLIVTHDSWLFGRISGCAIRAEVDETEGFCGTGLVHGLESRESTVLTHALDLRKVKAACSEWCHGDSP